MFPIINKDKKETDYGEKENHSSAQSGYSRKRRRDEGDGHI